jgi:hypothetical protein
MSGLSEKQASSNLQQLPHCQGNSTPALLHVSSTPALLHVSSTPALLHVSSTPALLHDNPQFSLNSFVNCSEQAATGYM